jgi:hypothetical protein
MPGLKGPEVEALYAKGRDSLANKLQREAQLNKGKYEFKY